MSEEALNALFANIGIRATELAIEEVGASFPTLSEADAARLAFGVLLTSAVVTAASGGIGRAEIVERSAAIVASACDDVCDAL